VRIARQLTDGPATGAGQLILRAEIVQRVAEHAPETLDAELVGLRTLAAKSLLDIRRAIFEMRPLGTGRIGPRADTPPLRQ